MRPAALALVLATVACGAAPDAPPDATAPVDAGTVTVDAPPPVRPPAPQPLAVQPVAWNAMGARVGSVSAVAEAGGLVVVFSDTGATVLAGGAVAATSATIRAWRAAAAIPAGAGTGTWVAGVDGDGRVHRLRAMREWELVSDRYGLAMERVRALAALGGSAVGFGTERGVAVADGTVVRRYMDGTFERFAGGSGRVAGAGMGGVRVLDARENRLATYALPGASHVAIDAEGRLVAATARVLYREDARGVLQPRYESAGGEIHGMATSGAAVWFAVGTELGVIEGDLVSVTRGADVAATTTLVGASGGEVWTLAGGALGRYRRDGAMPTAAQQWNATVRPAFVRACAACHLPGGSARIDLSTYEAWETRRALIRQRVVDRMPSPMPPAGSPITEADRDVIAQWTRR